MKGILEIVRNLCIAIGALALIAGFIASIALCPPAVPIGIATLVGGFGIGYRVGKSDASEAKDRREEKAVADYYGQLPTL